MNYLHKDEMALAWINLSYVSPSLLNGQAKPILVKLNGQVNFHTVTALMGPSGAGKTTLLKCINMRNKNGLTGDSRMFVNKYTPLRTCFIMQDSTEHLFMGLTVRESLLFASKIKNLSTTVVKYRDNYAQTGSSLLTLDNLENESHNTCFGEYEPIDEKGKFDHNSNVDKILKELLLTDCAPNSVNECSGGEQKRLSVGMELVSHLKPNLLCIDEPTSGLDSNAAELVIQCLSQLTLRHQMAIVTSIHQPNSLLLNMFDQLYVLSKGGYCVFRGRPNLLRQHLADCQVNCPEDVLPIELLLKISSKLPERKHNLPINTISNNNNGISNQNNGKALNLEIDSGQSEQIQLISGADNEIDRLIDTVNKSIANILGECKTNGKLVSSKVNKQTQSFKFHHFYYLLMRGFACFLRYQWKTSASLGLFSLVTTSMLIYLYGTDIGEESGCIDLFPSNITLVNNTFEEALRLLGQDSKIMLNLKCQFFVVAFLQFVSMACIILMFPQEVRVFVNEHQNRWYSTSSYFWSKFILEMPPIIIISYVYSFIMYYGTGQLNETYRFSLYTSLTLAGVVVINGLGTLIGIVFAYNFQVAITSGVALYLILMLLCGFFVPLNSQHEIIRAISFGSVSRLSFESIMSVVYGLDRCEPPKQPLLLHQLQLEPDAIWYNIWFIIGQLILFRFVALFALIIRANDFNIISYLRPKPKLNSDEDERGLTFVSNYLNN